MTSNIKNFTDNIDTNFPVQGRDNPSQGFRDNFAQIKLALITAADEISNVQSSPGGVFTLTSATSTVLGGVKIGTGFRVEGDGTLFIDDIYVLPVATPLSLGGVKQGANVEVSGDGTISVADPYVLNTATTTALGGVKVGTGLRASSDGTISINSSLPLPYDLPIASQFDLGAVKIGSNITIADGFISVAAPYSLPAATTSVLGGVKVGSNISVAIDGTISTGDPYVLPTATTSTLGGVIAGSGITINGSGVISAPYTYTLPIASTSTVGGVKIGENIFVDAEGLISVTAPYALPTASNTVKGGVKIGNGLSVDGSGFLNTELSAVIQNIVPSNDVTYNLGSATRRWKDLYLSSSTIYLGDTSISASSGVISIPSLSLSRVGVVSVGVVVDTQDVGGDLRYVVDQNWFKTNAGVYGPFESPLEVNLNNLNSYDNVTAVAPRARAMLDADGYISEIVVEDPGFYTTGSYALVQDGISIEPVGNEPITLLAKSVGLVPPGGGTYTGDFYNIPFTYTWDGNQGVGEEVLVGVDTFYGILRTWRFTYGYYKVVGSTLVEVDASQISSGDPILKVYGSADISDNWGTTFNGLTALPFSACAVGDIAFTSGVLATSSDLAVDGSAVIKGSLTVETDITFADGTVLTSAIPTLPLYTTSTLSTIASTATGAMVLVTDLVGGGLPCFFDGADWKTFSGTAI